MRILHLVDSVPRGGTETLLYDYANNIIKYDHKSIVVSLGLGAMSDDFVNSKIDFRILKRKFPVDPQVILKLRNIIIAEDIEVIHTHSDVVAVHAYFACLTLKTKIVLSFHGNLYTDRYNLKRNLSLKFLVPRMNACVAVSRSYLHELSKRALFPTDDFKIVYNGIDFKKFISVEGSLKRELHLSEEVYLIGMIGNFNWVRDQMSICKALPDLFTKMPQARFVFVGARSEKLPEVYDNCVNYCKQHNILDKVYFLGRRSDVSNILNSLDLYLYASKSDSFGISVVEAMYSGVPVLINDLPVFLELTENGKYATIFESGNQKDIVDKAYELSASPGSNKKAESAKAYVANKFSIEEYIKNLEKLYQHLL